MIFKIQTKNNKQSTVQKIAFMIIVQLFIPWYASDNYWYNLTINNNNI